MTVRVVELAEYALGELDGVGADGPVLPVRFDGALALIGPVSDGVCVACAEDARLAALGPATPRGDRRMRLGG